MGELALLFVILFRGLIPFTLFKWPFWGAVACIVGDISDVMIFEAFGSGPLGDDLYHNLDKFFDTYYLFFEFLVVRRWTNVLARRTGKVLFGWRAAGFLIFEGTSALGAPFRPAFFLASNIFEHWYLVWSFIQRYIPRFHLTRGKLIIILIIVGAPKVAQEYIMHYAYPDQTWNFIRDHLFWWLYV